MVLLCCGFTMLLFNYAIHPLRNGSPIGLYRRRQPATATTQERKGNDDQLPHNYPGMEKQGQPATTTTQEQKKDRLYRAVERHAKGIGELPSLRRDIINLGKPRLQSAYKLIVTSRMQHATRDLPPTDGVRGRNCIMKDMYGGIVAYESILLSEVAPEEFYRVIIDEVIRDDVL
ncbi:hypothetical protein GIB67_008887 [Kingdonia uniflora]|uniref:Uncharacterized protein n=1 Tax=Kingdonia uniflora TaxID=39325 RepID=A0A7J7LVA3_9MAGN|nr:hypothetical protein GIB67_008887 [Kingdonia uniflora]